MNIHSAVTWTRSNADDFAAAPLNRLRGLWRDRRGSVAMMAAFTFPLVIGGAGLGAEVGYWYLSERKLQHAADVAAYAAALRLRAGEDDQATLDAIALHIATESGFKNGANDGMEVIHPWVDSAGVEHDEKVGVVLTEEIDPLFSKFFGRSGTEVAGSAVAQVSGSDVACVLALSHTANNALYAKGSASATFENCIAATNSSSNSAFHMQGATFNVDCVRSHGGYTETGNSNSLTMSKCEEVETGADRLTDPYAGVTVPVRNQGAPAPSSLSLNGQALTTAGTHSVSGLPYRNVQDLTLKGNVTVAAGLYIVEGDLTINGNALVTGSEVTFVVYGSVKMNGSADFTLSAPTATTNPYRGLLLFGDRDTTIETIRINGNATSVLQGAIYFPTGNLTFSGSSSLTDGCTQLVANTIEFSGNSGLHSSCAAAGTEDINAGGGSVALYE